MAGGSTLMAADGAVVLGDAEEGGIEEYTGVVMVCRAVGRSQAERSNTETSAETTKSFIGSI